MALALTLVSVGCSDDLDSPTLPTNDGISLPEGVEISANRLFGDWVGRTYRGNTNANYFTQEYKVSFQCLEDAEAVVTHRFTDASTEMEDSTVDYEYTYSFNGKDITMKPKERYALNGASVIKGVSIGEDRILLYTEHQGVADSICTLTRTGKHPAAVITNVDRTLPLPGDIVTITGRNLQLIDKVYFPIASGETEMTIVEAGSKQIKVAVADAEYVPGAIRCHGSEEETDCYSPAYMFCTNTIFFHNFKVSGSTANKYAGSEFEYTISGISASNKMMSGAANTGITNLPAGHSLLLVSSSINNPDSLLSIPAVPGKWDVAANNDTQLGYIRFSSGDRLEYAMNNSNGTITRETPCAGLAIQMDIYVYTDGKPEWSTGYLCYRMNKNSGKTEASGQVANMALWEDDSPVSFEDGWKTLTIPLSRFTVTAKDYTTLGAVIDWQKKNNLQSLLTFVNYGFDSLHTPAAAESFQFNIANIRLVPYSTAAGGSGK